MPFSRVLIGTLSESRGVDSIVGSKRSRLNSFPLSSFGNSTMIGAGMTSMM
ncbi:hypothetical protein D3C83_332690 [compost metagenome]